MAFINETGLTSLIERVDFDFGKGEPTICQRCGKYSENIITITAHIIYAHPEGNELVVDSWQTGGCGWCINKILGSNKTKPPPNRFIPIAT